MWSLAGRGGSWGRSAHSTAAHTSHQAAKRWASGPSSTRCGEQEVTALLIPAGATAFRRGRGGNLPAGSRRAEETARVTRVGLVLGAGGVVGQAYHAGVLAVLEHDFGFDPRGVDMIVGTSAGSITGTLLRLGVRGGGPAAPRGKAPPSARPPTLRQL